jgi:hypothetical protein
MKTISILGCSALAGLALAAPAPAATVSPTHVRNPQIAVGAGGATVVAWERLGRDGISIEARVGRSASRLGKVSRLAGRGYRPQVAVGANGTTAVQWMAPGADRSTLMRVAVARPGHGFGRAQTLERRVANIAPLAVAVQPNGRVVAIWRRSNSQLGVALAAPGRRFGASADLTTNGLASPGSVAVDPRDGTVVLAYGTPLSATPTPTNEQAAVRTLGPAAAAFSQPTVLTASGPGTGPLNDARPVAITGPAGAGVAYTILGLPSLNIARRGLDGSWATTQRIAMPLYPVGSFVDGLNATLPADGAAAGAWSVAIAAADPFADPVSKQTIASIATSAAPLGAIQEISPGGATFGRPVLASAGDEAFLATAETHGRVLLATRGAGGARFQGAVALTTKGDGDVLLSAAGSHVIAGYQQADRLRLKIVR